MNGFKANVRVAVVAALEVHLRHQPTRVSKSRIKRLQGLSRPQYRLRIGDDVRVFYDVIESAVQVLAMVSKSDAEAWLKKHGEIDETGSALGNQG